MRVPRPTAVLVLLLLTAGCEDRVSQCNRLIEQLNPRTDALIRGVEALSRVESEPEVVDRLVGVIDETDRELAVLQLQDERLAGFALRYRRQLGDAREAAQSMLDATREHDAARLNAAATQADVFLETQATILEELNAYCGG